METRMRTLEVAVKDREEMEIKKVSKESVVVVQGKVETMEALE